MSNLKQINEDIKKDSMFKNLINGIKNISDEQLKKVGVALGGSVIIALMSIPISNATIEKKLMDGMNLNDSSVKKIETLLNNYENSQDDKVFALANKIGSFVSKSFHDAIPLSNAEYYLRDLMSLVSPHETTRDIQKAILMIEHKTNEYLTTNKIDAASEIGIQIKAMSEESIKPLQEEFELRAKIEKKYFNDVSSDKDRFFTKQYEIVDGIFQSIGYIDFSKDIDKNSIKSEIEQYKSEKDQYVDLTRGI